MPEIKIDRLTHDRVEDVYRIEKECFKDPWSKKSIDEEINREISCFLILLVDGETAGYLNFWNILGESSINRVAVSKKYRRQGLAYKLLQEIFLKSKELCITDFYLEVRKSNISAIKLYEKCGFYKTGLRKNFYDDGEDALLYTKKFPQFD